jgi:hypothetical protein
VNSTLHFAARESIVYVKIAGCNLVKIHFESWVGEVAVIRTIRRLGEQETWLGCNVNYCVISRFVIFRIRIK